MNLGLHIFLFLLFGSVALADVKLRTNSSAEVENLQSREKISLPANESLNLTTSDPYLIRMPEMVPVLVVPIQGGSSDVNLQGYPLKEVLDLQAQKDADKVLSNLLAEVGSIQNLVRRRETQLASEKLTELQRKYPGVTSLKFIRASILYLQGKKVEAEVLTIEALKDHPDNAEGKKFLAELKGKS